MKIKIDLADNFIDVWNEEKEIWERYVKVGLEEEKKIPEKLNDDNAIWEEQARDIDYDFKNTINEIIDYLKSKGE